MLTHHFGTSLSSTLAVAVFVSARCQLIAGQCLGLFCVLDLHETLRAPITQP
jgi:hypothetical protein